MLIASRILLIPVIAGVSYELLRFSGLRAEGTLGKVLSAPGLWLQRLTTRVPEGPMIPVAVASLLAAMDPMGRAEVESRGELDERPEASSPVGEPAETLSPRPPGWRVPLGWLQPWRRPGRRSADSLIVDAGMLERLEETEREL